MSSYCAKVRISDTAEEFLLKQVDLMFGDPELPSRFRRPARLCRLRRPVRGFLEERLGTNTLYRDSSDLMLPLRSTPTAAARLSHLCRQTHQLHDRKSC